MAVEKRGRDTRRRPARPEREWLYGIHPVREALRARRRTLHRLCIQRGPARSELEDLRVLAEGAGILVEEVDALPRESDANPQGVMLEVSRLPETTLESLLVRKGSNRIYVALDGVEDPQNVGSIARVAEGVGAAGLILTERRAARIGPAAARASAGAVEWLPIARVPNLGRALEVAKREGCWVFGAELGAGSSLFDIPDRQLGGDAIVVLGAEGRGLRPGVSKHVDFRVEVPMFGEIASLNVATAAAVILFELRRRMGLAVGV